jgi:murein DD-endopeptidase MepM/ murein hydrolase activator NlpD
MNHLTRRPGVGGGMRMGFEWTYATSVTCVRAVRRWPWQAHVASLLAAKALLAVVIINVVAYAQGADEVERFVVPGVIRPVRPDVARTRPFFSTVERETAQILRDEAESRALVAQVVGTVGLDTWEHPEIAKLTDATSDIPTGDLVRRRAEFLQSMPIAAPALGWISSPFGERKLSIAEHKAMHKGVDIANLEGSPIVAPGDGVVRFAGKYGRFGNYVAIVHGYGIVTKYGHMSAIQVKAGQRVKRGDVLGAMGTTGRSTGSHLHYEVWVNEKPVDPAPFLPLETTLRGESIAAAK